MTEYTVKKAEIRELETLMTIICEARRAIASLGIDQWQDGYPGKDVILSDIESQNMYGAYENGVPAAVAAIISGIEPVYAHIDGEWKTEGPYITVHRMAASDAARGKGASLALMKKAEEIAHSQGAVSVRVDTHLGNKVMRRFLSKQGFEECGLVDYSSHTTGDPMRIAYEKRL